MCMPCSTMLVRPAYDRSCVLMQASKLRRSMTEAESKKQHNRITHSAPGSVKVKSARKKKIVAEVD